MPKVHKFIIGIALLTINSVCDELVRFLVRFLVKLILNLLV